MALRFQVGVASRRNLNLWLKPAPTESLRADRPKNERALKHNQTRLGSRAVDLSHEQLERLIRWKVARYGAYNLARASIIGFRCGTEFLICFR